MGLLQPVGQQHAVGQGGQHVESGRCVRAAVDASLSVVMSENNGHVVLGLHALASRTALMVSISG
jgi:hypothetical protein